MKNLRTRLYFLSQRSIDITDYYKRELVLLRSLTFCLFSIRICSGKTRDTSRLRTLKEYSRLSNW